MGYAITGIPAATSIRLRGRSDRQLARQGVERIRVTAKPGYPCRVTLRDADPGETVLLLNYVSHAVDSPYRSAYAIYVREQAEATARFENELAPVLRGRPIALRLFDSAGRLLGEELDLAGELEEKIQRGLAQPDVAYLHAHNAAHGCFAAEIRRF